jgi:hypothetical protein
MNGSEAPESPIGRWPKGVGLDENEAVRNTGTLCAVLLFMRLLADFIISQIP